MMKLNPFDTISDYSKMLNKIASFTFFISLACFWMLTENIAILQTINSKLQFSIKIIDVPIPGFIVIASLLTAILARAIRLHDRISDMFRIRHYFDIYVILIPLALICGVSRSCDFIDRIAQNRKRLMSRVFYEYASSKSPNPAIDRHLIEKALDLWVWYWIVVEGVAVCVFAGTILLVFCRAYLQSAILFLLTTIALLFLPYIWILCRGAARSEIDAIAVNGSRCEAIRSEFNAI